MKSILECCCADASYLEEASGPASLSPSASYEFELKSTNKLNGKKLYGKDCSVQTSDACETSEVGENVLYSLYDDDKCLQKGLWLCQGKGIIYSLCFYKSVTITFSF